MTQSVSGRRPLSVSDEEEQRPKKKKKKQILSSEKVGQKGTLVAFDLPSNTPRASQSARKSLGNAQPPPRMRDLVKKRRVTLDIASLDSGRSQAKDVGATRGDATTLPSSSSGPEMPRAEGGLDVQNHESPDVPQDLSAPSPQRSSPSVHRTGASAHEAIEIMDDDEEPRASSNGSLLVSVPTQSSVFAAVSSARQPSNSGANQTPQVIELLSSDDDVPAPPPRRKLPVLTMPVKPKQRQRIALPRRTVKRPKVPPPSYKEDANGVIMLDDTDEEESASAPAPAPAPSQLQSSTRSPSTSGLGQLNADIGSSVGLAPAPIPESSTQVNVTHTQDPAPAPTGLPSQEDGDVEMVDAEAISSEPVGDVDIADAEMNDSSLQPQDEAAAPIIEASSRTVSVPPLVMSDEVVPDVPCQDDAELASVHTVAGDHVQQTSPSSRSRRGSQSSAESRASTIRTASPKEPTVETSIPDPQTPISRTITKPSRISVPPRSSPHLGDADSLRADTASPVSSILDPHLQDLALSTPTEVAANGLSASTSHSSLDTTSSGKTC